MGRRSVEAAGHPVEHVADVADEGVRDGRRVNPAARRFHLQSPGIVLPQHRQQPVVGVLADAPRHLVRRFVARRWIVEDTEQDERIARVAIGEIRRLEPQTERDAPHEHVSQSGHRVHVVQNGLPEAGDIGKEIAAVQRHACRDLRMIGPKLGAEVQPLLLIGPAAREFAADGKIPAPRTASPLHADGELGLEILLEELPAEPLEAPLQLTRHAVADDVEESVLAARTPEHPGGAFDVTRTRNERRDVDDGQLRRFAVHATLPRAPGARPAGRTLAGGS